MAREDFINSLVLQQLTTIEHKTLPAKVAYVNGMYTTLTPRRVLIEKLTVVQLVKKSSAFYENREAHCFVHMRPPLAPDEYIPLCDNVFL
jgi:hypothetical protein